jgi:O-antigen ligase
LDALVTSEAGELPSPAAERANLSRTIIFLVTIRPLLNLIGDSSLFDIGTYKVSILSIWSLIVLACLARRYSMGTPLHPTVKRCVQAFFVIVVMLGMPRMYVGQAFIKDVLMYTQFFLIALTAQGVIEDVGVDYIVRRFTLSMIALVTIHVTLGAAHAVEAEEAIGSYLGLFPDKHLAASSFFVAIPWLVVGAFRNPRGLSAAMLFPTIFFLLLTFQRTSIVSLAVMGLMILIAGRRVRWLFPMALLVVVILAATPKARMEEFVNAKIDQEIESVAEGDVNAGGAGRAGIALLAYSQFVDDSSPFEQLLGRGTAQAYRVSEVVLGEPVYAHVQLVELIVDYGLIGAGLVIVIFGILARAKWRALAEDRSPEQLVGFAIVVVVFVELFFAMPMQDATVTLLAMWLFPTLARPEPEVADVAA